MKKFAFLLPIWLFFAFQMNGQNKHSEKSKEIDFRQILEKERFESATSWFNKTDSNEDGLISREEFPEKYNHLWDLVDTDRSGDLTLEEELSFQILEQEKEVMQRMCKENRIFTIQEKLELPLENKNQDISGEWICFATMSSGGDPGNGIMYINLTQNEGILSGELQQLKFPKNEEIRYINFSNDWAAIVEGEIIPVKGEKPAHNMMFLKRTNLQNDFQAIFSGYISVRSDSIVAQLINNMGHYGTMLMVKRKIAHASNLKDN
jgi:hypothetical protein